MYKPLPLDTSDVVLPENIILLTEQIAKNTHENWSKNKMDDGWVYGPELNHATKTHPCLVQYEKLSEADKDYDRTTAVETIKFLIKMGYKIEK